MNVKKFASAVVLAALFATGGARAQVARGPALETPSHAGETKPAHSTRIVLLGTTAGPIVRADRSEPATLLEVDGRPYLIDAGSGVSHQLVLAGFRPPQIHTIFFTHFHVDHDAGFPALMSFQWFESSFGRAIQSDVRPQTRYEIYGPPGTKFLLNTALQYLSVSERIFRAGLPDKPPAAPMFAAHDIDIGTGQHVVYRDDLIQVTAVQNTHYHEKSGSAEEQDKSYSYRFDTPAGSVLITGDTGPSEAVTDLAKNADVLVSEVIRQSEQTPPMEAQGRHAAPGEALSSNARLRAEMARHMLTEHLSPEAIGRMAAAAHVKVVVLTHFAGGGDRITDMTSFTAGVSKYFAGAVMPGRDMFEYDLFKYSP